MPAFAPSAATLLQAAADDLERDVLPALQSFPRFRTRVVVNLLRLVTRELDLGMQADSAELARLRALLDDGDTALPASSALPALRERLAQRIEAGAFALDDAALLYHLCATLRDALAIDSPHWVGDEG